MTPPTEGLRILDEFHPTALGENEMGMERGAAQTSHFIPSPLSDLLFPV